LNVTLSSNSATTGGALYMLSGYPTLLTNTIIAYRPAGGNCSGTISSSIYSISSDNTCALAGLVKTLNPNNLDPLLTALGNYGGPTLVHMLKLGSPAIDVIPKFTNGCGTTVSTNQRGAPRPINGKCDIGAVERQLADSDLAPRLYLPLIVR